MTLFGIPIGLVVTTLLRVVNYVTGKMQVADIRKMVNDENYVRERTALDAWLAECDKIWEEQKNKPRTEVDKDLEEDLS